MDAAMALANWPIWAVLVVATLAFWTVTFLAVRALFTGRATVDPEDVSPLESPQERLARGEISIEEFLRLSTEAGIVKDAPHSRATPPPS